MRSFRVWHIYGTIHDEHTSHNQTSEFVEPKEGDVSLVRKGLQFAKVAKMKKVMSHTHGPFSVMSSPSCCSSEFCSQRCAFVSQSTDVVNAFFRELEQEQFPHDVLATEYPEAVREWKSIGELQNVPCEWVTFCELGLVFFFNANRRVIPY